MLRHLALVAASLAALSAGAAAEETWLNEEAPLTREHRTAERDPFVISGDACGASEFAHLVGSDFARVYQAALVPSDTNVVRNTLTTLEYKPERLNVVLSPSGAIVSIGCF